MRDPTMQKPSSKAGSQERRNYQALLQQLKNLESEWESIEKSRQRTPRRCSSSAAPAASILALLDNSPRDLMSSLQHRESPSVGVLRLKNNSGMAVQEILMDRRAATMSGKLKPRRLFGPPETPSSGEELDLNYGSGGGDEICCDWLNMSEEREVSINENCSISTRNIVGEEQELIDVSKQSCSFSDSSLSEEKVVVQKEEEEEEEEEEKTVVQEAIVAEKGAKVTGGGRHMAAMAWFGFVVILLILGFISMSCNGKYVHGNEFILVPT
ncbi:hypothetical protein Salat_0018600 [Sesamum alatum]|uniref:Uncharacterized protein n=1 Tax=Sesamum alatum TaxID=300844 RepID=A0AAE2CW85_9LAMI|nr:hypothetical protein Salat_0018600 [Sesamum alatum]